MTKNYYLINETTNVCENIVVWDGNTDTWKPPQSFFLLEQDSTPSKVWAWNKETNDWEICISDYANIGFTWDGSYLNTNEEKPTYIPKF